MNYQERLQEYIGKMADFCRDPPQSLASPSGASARTGVATGACALVPLGAIRSFSKKLCFQGFLDADSHTSDIGHLSEPPNLRFG